MTSAWEKEVVDKEGANFLSLTCIVTKCEIPSLLLYGGHDEDELA